MLDQKCSIIIVHFLLRFFFCTFCCTISCFKLNIKIYQFYVKEELLSLLRVYRKSATSAKTDGRIATDGPLYSGTIVTNYHSFLSWVVCLTLLIKNLSFVSNCRHLIFNSYFKELFYYGFLFYDWAVYWY